MTIIEQWAVQLAEAAVPGEMELAPRLVDTYISYGTCYPVNVEAAYGNSAIGLNPGGMLLLPVLFDAIAVTAKLLRPLLGLSELKELISTINEMLDLRGRLVDTPVTVQSDSLPWDDLLQVINTVQNELIETGLPEDKAELITFRVLKALIADPSGSLEFISLLPDREL